MKKVELANGGYALVSDADYKLVSPYKWYSWRAPGKKTSYAVTGIKQPNGKWKTGVRMHRFILNAAPDVQVDHKNHDGLDNRRSNIRICTASQNNCNKGPSKANTTGLKGVSFDKRRGKYEAYIERDGKKQNLGYFDNKIDAGRAYDAAAPKYHGKYAYLNNTLDVKEHNQF